MVFDGHSDILTDVLKKRLAGEREIIKRHHLKRLQEGGIEGACFVFWIDPPFTENPNARLTDLIEAFQCELQETKEIKLIRKFPDIAEAKRQQQFYILLGMEGFSPLSTPEELYELFDIGVRHGMLTWNEENMFATGVRGDENRGLTTLGKEAVLIMERLGMVVDVSHLNERSFFDVCDVTTKPIVASHSNASHFAPVPRNLTKEQLLEIRAKKGLVGLNAYQNFVHTKKEKQTADTLIEHAIYIAETIGTESLAFGFDFLEFLDDEPVLRGLEDCRGVPHFLEQLKKVGFTELEVEKMAFGNWHRILKEVLK